LHVSSRSGFVLHSAAALDLQAILSNPELGKAEKAALLQQISAANRRSTRMIDLKVSHHRNSCCFHLTL
jgi:hypothetical protein